MESVVTGGQAGVAVAVISGLCLVIAAWLPNRRMKRVESQFSTNGGSSAKDQLNRIETGIAHLTGRFDQHVTDSTSDKDAAHREAVRMWAAIEAVAKAEPPQGAQHG